MNSDLISREAAIDALHTLSMYYGPYAEEALKEGGEKLKRLPAVDAVEVVRCKDCKYRGDAYKCPMYFAHWHCDDDDRTEDEGFCAYGERRKGDENEAD